MPKKPSEKVKPVQNDRIMLQRLAIYIEMFTEGIYPSAMPAIIAAMTPDQNPTGWKPSIDEIYEMSKKIKEMPRYMDLSDEWLRSYIDLCCMRIHAEAMKGSDFKSAIGSLALMATCHQLGRPEKKKPDEAKKMNMKELRSSYKREVGEK